MELSLKSIVRSRKVVVGGEVIPAAVAISNHGEILMILKEPDLYIWDERADEVIDVGDLLVLPGVVDSHVHVNEPGRTDWEGFWSVTRAAAAGGVTTIVDMPLNSIPPTTTVGNFKEKLKAAEGQIHVDAAFWGGLVPDNKDSLLDLIEEGVVGFKCFLCHSGVDEFPKVEEKDVEEALSIMSGKPTVLAFHAESDASVEAEPNADRSKYQTFLKTRPPKMEIEAVEMISKLCKKYQVPCHIVHASSHRVLDVVRQAKDEGAPLTTETCHHYLTLDSESVKIGDASYKCCPPIREKENKEHLWKHLKSGNIDLVVSDHSPCPPVMKHSSDFISSWGGIASVQFGLQLLYTEGVKRGVPITTITKLLSEGPASVSGLTKKGAIEVGKDADLVIFDPDETWIIHQDDILHKHKLTPYLGKEVQGTVIRTILRGSTIYHKNAEFPPPSGKFLFRRKQSS